ncbi:MAG: MerC domain-containing protein [Verrucomicrobiota bacterium]
MSALTKVPSQSQSWLDSVAVGMSLLCAIHCLITPILIVFLPIITTTFWVHQDFHLWMLLFVVPTTTLAVFLGCKKHKDRWVIILGLLGIITLSCVAIHGSFLTEVSFLQADGTVCPHCVQEPGRSLTDPVSIINSLGGLFLICGHVRNFLLCRKHQCQHG